MNMIGTFWRATTRELIHIVWVVNEDQQYFEVLWIKIKPKAISSRPSIGELNDKI